MPALASAISFFLFDIGVIGVFSVGTTSTLIGWGLSIGGSLLVNFIAQEVLRQKQGAPQLSTSSAAQSVVTSAFPKQYIPGFAEVGGWQCFYREFNQDAPWGYRTCQVVIDVGIAPMAGMGHVRFNGLRIEELFRGLVGSRKLFDENGNRLPFDKVTPYSPLLDDSVTRTSLWTGSRAIAKTSWVSRVETLNLLTGGSRVIPSRTGGTTTTTPDLVPGERRIPSAGTTITLPKPYTSYESFQIRLGTWEAKTAFLSGITGYDWKYNTFTVSRSSLASGSVTLKSYYTGRRFSHISFGGHRVYLPGPPSQYIYLRASGNTLTISSTYNNRDLVQSVTATERTGGTLTPVTVTVPKDLDTYNNVTVNWSQTIGGHSYSTFFIIAVAGHAFTSGDQTFSPVALFGPPIGSEATVSYTVSNKRTISLTADRPGCSLTSITAQVTSRQAVSQNATQFLLPKAVTEYEEFEVTFKPSDGDAYKKTIRVSGGVGELHDPRGSTSTIIRRIDYTFDGRNIGFLAAPNYNVSVTDISSVSEKDLPDSVREALEYAPYVLAEGASDIPFAGSKLLKVNTYEDFQINRDYTDYKTLVFVFRTETGEDVSRRVTVGESITGTLTVGDITVSYRLGESGNARVIGLSISAGILSITEIRGYRDDAESFHLITGDNRRDKRDRVVIYPINGSRPTRKDAEGNYIHVIDDGGSETDPDSLNYILTAADVEDEDNIGEYKYKWDGKFVFVVELHQPYRETSGENAQEQYDVLWAGFPNIQFGMFGNLIQWPIDTAGNLNHEPEWTDSLMPWIYWWGTHFVEKPPEIFNAPSMLAAHALGDQTPVLRDAPPKGFDGIYKRYSINGVIRAGDDPRQVLDEMLFAGAAQLVEDGGQWYLLPGAEPTGTAIITDDDIIKESVEIQPVQTLSQRYNSISVGLAQSKPHEYESYQLPEIRDEAAINRDGGVIHADTGTRQFVNEPIKAQQLGMIQLRLQRGALRVSMTLRHGDDFKNFNHRIGDLVRVRYEQAGWNDDGIGKKFVIEQMSIRTVDGPQVALTMREYVEGVYDDVGVLPGLRAPETPPSIRPPTPPAVEGLTISTREYLEGVTPTGEMSVAWTDTETPISVLVNGPGGFLDYQIAVDSPLKLTVTTAGTYRLSIRHIVDGNEGLVSSRDVEILFLGLVPGTGKATLSDTWQGEHTQTGVLSDSANPRGILVASPAVAGLTDGAWDGQSGWPFGPGAGSFESGRLDLESAKAWEVRIRETLVTPPNPAITPDTTHTLAVRHGTDTSLTDRTVVTAGAWTTLSSSRYIAARVELPSTYQGAGLTELILEWRETA